jgi:hypothetical protein
MKTLGKYEILEEIGLGILSEEQKRLIEAWLSRRLGVRSR